MTFGRKDLRDIQEEVGRLLYSDTFNTAVRNRTDGDSGTTITTVNGSVKTGEADPKETGCNGTFKHRYFKVKVGLRWHVMPSVTLRVFFFFLTESNIFLPLQLPPISLFRFISLILYIFDCP